MSIIRNLCITFISLAITNTTLAMEWSKNDESKRNWESVSNDFQFDKNSIKRDGYVVSFEGLERSTISQPTNFKLYSINCKSYEYFDHNANAYLKALGSKKDMLAARIQPKSDMDIIYKKLCKK